MIKTDSTKIPEFNINEANTTCEVPTIIKDIIKNNAIALQKPNKEDKVNHPSHYTWLKKLCGIEVIDITRHLNFNLGNCIKYIIRSGHKSEQGMSDKQKQIEDLKKARFYIDDEIKRLENIM